MKSAKRDFMSIDISILHDKRRAKEGEVYPIKLRVYCSGKSPVLYQTIYDLSIDDFRKFSAKRISDSLAAIRENLNKVVRDAQAAAAEIIPFDFDRFYQEFIYGNSVFKEKRAKIQALSSKGETDAYPAEWVKKFPILTEEHPGPDYISKVYKQIVKNLLHEDRVGNASSYQSSYSSLKAFRGNVRFCAVTKQYLKEYDNWMVKEKGNSKTTVGIYTRALRAVVNEAIELKLMRADDYPFGRRRFLIPTGKNKKKALEKPVLAQLYYSETEKVSLEKAKDFWFLGYYCVGINVRDIVELKAEDVDGDYLAYERGKIRNTASGREAKKISVFITDDLRRIIDKWRNKDKSPGSYLFPILNPGMTAVEIFDAKRNFTRWINKNIAKICKKEGISQKINTMEYRHSASTILKNAGVNGHYIKDLMGHTSLKTQENYFGSFEDAQQKEYAKALDGFKSDK